jgi:plastocyanin domain-containing protein
MVVAIGAVGCKRRHRARRARPIAAAVSSQEGALAENAGVEALGRVVPIDVGEHGFSPTEIEVTKGEPTTLVFTRTSNSTCAFNVVFPELNLDKELPFKRAVYVPVPVDSERTLTFQCGMGMYKSHVVVK